MPVLDPFGLRRVIQPAGSMPQAAEKLDPTLPLADDELEIEVDHLNIDAASFRQIESTVADEAEIATRIQEIVRTRGKMQNPVTGSGGMLIGRISRVGAHHPARDAVRPGDRIATLVSLTLTPLIIDEIKSIHSKSERVDIRGKAILFASGVFAPLPDDFPEPMALAIFDVCGAPAWVGRLAQHGATVLVIGAGKSGSLACAIAKEKVGSTGKVLSLDLHEAAPKALVRSGLADVAMAANARHPVAVMDAVRAATDGQMADLVVNCASVSGTEMASIVSVKDRGEVLFFSMATSFSAAALGAEGIGRDVRLYIGNGYAHGHAAFALDLVRRTPALRVMFEERVA